MELAAQLISTLGFPIACAIALGVFAYKLVTRVQDESRSREERLTACIDKFGDNLKEITETLSVMNNRLTDIEEKIEV